MTTTKNPFFITQRHVAAAAWAALSCLPALGQPAPQLTPAPERITDAAIQSDHGAFEAMQGRIKALNDAGRRVADYHLSKAQCWLDSGFHEYTRNDRSAFPQAALDEAGKLVAGMEQGAAPLPMETPLVNGAARLRPDLWAKAGSLKSHAGFQCAQRAVACAEVELVHAGNEFNQQQWRHAKPYVQIAEDLVAQAQRLADGCPSPVPVVAAAQPVAPAAPVAEAKAPAAGMPPVQVMFAFDRFGEADIHGSSLAQLRALADSLDRGAARAARVRLTGHADRMNDTGRPDYNLRLSESRVATVRELLVRWGVDASLIRTDAKGDAQPVQDCGAIKSSAKQLQECMLPNRRVEVTVLPSSGD